MKKSNTYLNISLAIFRFTRAFLILYLSIIFIASVLQIINGTYAKVDMRTGGLRIPATKWFTVTVPAISIPITIQFGDIEYMTVIHDVIKNKEIRATNVFESALRIINPSLFQKTLSILFILIEIISTIFVFHLLIKIMNNYKSNNLFNLKNIFYLKVISLIMIYIPLILLLLYNIYYCTISTPLISTGALINKLGFSLNYNLNVEYLLFTAAGGFLFAISKVVENGFILKQENDLTV